MEKNNKDDAVRPGFVVGRICSLPVKAAIAIGKKTLGFAIRTQNEYDNMGSRSRKTVEDIAFGKRYGTPEEKVAARMYIKDSTNKSK